MGARSWASLMIGAGLLACRPEPPVADGGPPAVAASRPSAPHPGTSSTTIDLSELFRMPIGPEVAIEVGERRIERAQLERRLRRMQMQMEAVGVPPDLERRQVLASVVDQLIDEAVLEGVASSLGAVPDPARIEAIVGEIEGRMAKEPTFKVFLAQAGNTHAHRREDARIDALRDAVMGRLAERMKVSTATVAEAYYRKHLLDFTEFGGVELWRIVIRAASTGPDRGLAERRALDVAQRAKKKASSFEALAQSYSEGGKSAEGGYLGFVPKSSLEAALEAKLWAAKKGQIVGPIEDGAGFSIYKVGATKAPRVRPFTEVADVIFTRTRLPALTRAYEQAIARAKATSAIRVHLPELEDRPR